MKKTISHYILRAVQNSDSAKLLQLHKNCIRQLCEKHYSEKDINLWIDSKNEMHYRDVPNTRVFIVCEDPESNKLIGFGILDIKCSSINGLYINPEYAQQGFGKIILLELEKIAYKKHLQSLELNATLNAVDFYRKQGYFGEEVSKYVVNGAELACIKMSKTLTSD